MRHMSQSASAHQDRMRVSQACDNCRDKKSKCDGTKPRCGRCQLRSLECYYGVTKRVKNQQAMKELATKVAQYESILKKNIPARQTSPQKDNQSNEQLVPASLVADHPSTSNVSEPTANSQSSARSESISAVDDSPATVSRRPSEIVSPVDTAMNTPEMWCRNLSDPISAPPRSLLQTACKAFFEGADVLLTFFDEEEFSILFEQVYTNTSRSPSKTALTQVCAVAAVGCQYRPLSFDTATRLAFLSIVKFNLEDCVEEAPLSAMRVMTLLCKYYTFEKRTAALMYVDMGLRLAKLHQNFTAICEYPSTPWQRVYNSLVFLDCWLCATTGHLPSSQFRELYPSLVTIGSRSPLVNIAVQVEMTKIAILSGSILQDVYHSRFFSTTTVISYRNQLQQWLLALPDYMRLDSLLSSHDRPRMMRSIFSVHLLYQTTVILVYRRALVEFTCSGRISTDLEVFSQTQRFLEPCLWTGRQVSKILEIALSQGQVLHKCWMFIHSAYSSGAVLLYFTANRLLHGDVSSGLTADLAAAKQCIDVLSFCGEIDETAKQYSKNLSLIHDNQVRIHQALVDLSQDGKVTEAETEYEQLCRLVVLSASFLIHPFDGGYQREVKTLQDTLMHSVVGKTQGTPITDHLDADMSSPGFPSSVQEGSSPWLWKDILFTKAILGEKPDQGKSKTTKQSAKHYSFTLMNDLVFGS